MIVIERNFCGFKFKNIFFSEHPFYANDCDFISFHYCKQKVELDGFTCREGYTSIIDLTKDLDELWNEMSRSNCRRHIRRAERMGIKIESEKYYEEFYDILKRFISKKCPSGPLLKIEYPTIDEIKRYGKLFTAKYNDEILVSHFYLEDKPNIMFCLLNASKRLEVDKKKANLIGCANRLLYWEVIKYAKEKNIRKFDVGGLWSEEGAKEPSQIGMNSFKLGFGGDVVAVYFYIKANSKRAKLVQVLYHLWGNMRSSIIELFH